MVLVDQSQLQQVLAVIDRHVYVGDLRASQRFPIEAIRGLAFQESSGLTGESSTCGACGANIGSCQECGTPTGQGG